jgi:hypothetical protein
MKFYSVFYHLLSVLKFGPFLCAVDFSSKSLMLVMHNLAGKSLVKLAGSQTGQAARNIKILS